MALPPSRVAAIAIIHAIVWFSAVLGSAVSFVIIPTRTSSTLCISNSKHRRQPSVPRASSSLPDYGTTSVEIDEHRLAKIDKWRRKDLDGKSLVDQTMLELENDADFQRTSERIATVGEKQMSIEERTKRRRALDSLGVPSFTEFLVDNGAADAPVLYRRDPEVLQLNIGLYCNQACGHCHVESSPLRTKEMMTAEVASKCIELLKKSPTIHTLDITGGAPELNDSFRLIVRLARSVRPDLKIIDRCNLTVLQEPGQEDLVSFLADHGVSVIASLPCYSAENVDKQRGSGVFERSIAALLALNEAGYGISDTDLELDLVYNPLGAFLPPPQESLQSKYKEELEENFGILFNQLYTMTNMPIKRFADFLHRRDELKGYMDLLVRNFNAETINNLMCRNTVSIGYDGRIFDCDFNQQLGYGIGSSSIHEGGKTVFDIESFDDLKPFAITNDNHCFGCTAGMGSS